MSASKTDVTKRKEAKAAVRAVIGSCGHAVTRVKYVPVKGRAKFVWHCEKCNAGERKG